MSATRPQLLVSVRNRDESLAAIDGGCNIVDIKEPANGSLGMAELAVIRNVCQSFRPKTPGESTVSISAALGELDDWKPDTVIPKLPPLDFVKLGLARMGNSGWRQDWMTTRRRFENLAVTGLNWVAVAYADWKRAHAPVPADVVATAIETQCAGLLIDTFVKDGRATTDWLDGAELSRLMETARSNGLMTALAGMVSLEDLEIAQIVRPDVIAVRTLACQDGVRGNPVCSHAVRRILDVIGPIAINRHIATA